MRSPPLVREAVCKCEATALRIAWSYIAQDIQQQRDHLLQASQQAGGSFRQFSERTRHLRGASTACSSHALTGGMILVYNATFHDSFVLWQASWAPAPRVHLTYTAGRPKLHNPRRSVDAGYRMTEWLATVLTQLCMLRRVHATVTLRYSGLILSARDQPFAYCFSLSARNPLFRVAQCLLSKQSEHSMAWQVSSAGTQAMTASSRWRTAVPTFARPQVRTMGCNPGTCIVFALTWPSMH